MQRQAAASRSIKFVMRGQQLLCGTGRLSFKAFKTLTHRDNLRASGGQLAGSVVAEVRTVKKRRLRETKRAADFEAIIVFNSQTQKQS